ncbi:uncharacterized protein with LGFP repeats [Motilibacter peucedani]|uniref:Uncharacterized protein with LGFP repeats n=1 Tax=Motilibacter peucedani TaxID=598650 RepID=A0A420XM28_9ACTN|nr:N-acetylmuramoyl-L-alanine amidase [Motilibacter peucedani]RKS71463.1 uncharacterized protein with LGFP repeats [Motilibacter peucedani]
MRPTTALLAVGILPAALALPVVTRAAPSPHAVAPRVSSVALSGVEARGLASVSGAHRPVLLSAQTPTTRFDLVAVTWAAGSQARDTAVQVRVRQHGAWTAWEALGQDDDGPDASSADARAQASGERAGSESLLVDGADALQVRVDGAHAPRAVRAELVDGGRSKADAALPELGASRAASSASADMAQPTIVTRAQWGADESLRHGGPYYTGTPKVGFIHHTASTNAYGPGDAAAQVRAMYAYHTKVHKWSDIGYNYLVDQYGTIYEGRAGGIDKNVLGAHTGGFNSDTFAISELGNFQTAQAPDAMVESVSQLMAWRLTLAHRDPNSIAHLVSAGGGTSKYKAGVGVDVPVVSGHRDVGATACPGANLYAKLPAIRARVSQLMGPMIFDPVVSPGKVGVGADGRAVPGQVAVSARTSDPQSWTLQVRDPSGAVVASSSGATTPDSLALTATWDLRVGGQQAPPATYALTLASTSPAGAVRSYDTTVTVGSAALTPTGAVTPAPPSVPAVPEPPQLSVVYTSPGKRTQSGRAWSTTCVDYHSTHRCAASSMSSAYVRDAKTHKVRHVTAMMFTGYGYSQPWTSAWDANPYATTGMKTIDGRLWLVACNVPSGPRICTVQVRTTVWERVVVHHAGAKDTVRFRQHERWKPNRVYRLFVNK